MINILLVDSDLDIIDLLEIYLTIRGYNVIMKATYGEEALDFFTKHHKDIDIVLISNKLFKNDGLTIAKEITRLSPKTKVIVMSTDPENRSKANDIGVFAFITKPFQLSNLINLLEVAIITNSGKRKHSN